MAPNRNREYTGHMYMQAMRRYGNRWFLIVDDAAVNLKILCKMLRGFKVGLRAFAVLSTDLSVVIRSASRP